MNDNYVTVRDLVDEFRKGLGDTTQEIPDFEIISYLNRSLREVAREKGLDKLFMHQSTFEMASINTDGTPSASWTLEKSPGGIIDIKDIRFLNTNGSKVTQLCPKYMDYKVFRSHYPVPEALSAGGNPKYFTFLQIGGKTRVMFSCPIDKPYVLDMVYSRFHPRARSMDDVIMVPYDYLDIVQCLMEIYYLFESADAATARAKWEDYDKLVAEARELLASQFTASGPRMIRGAF